MIRICNVATRLLVWALWPSAFWLASLALGLLACSIGASGDTNLTLLLLSFFAATVAVFGTPVTVLVAWLLRGRTRGLRATLAVIAALLAGPFMWLALGDTPLGVPVDALMTLSESTMKHTGTPMRSLVHF